MHVLALLFATDALNNPFVVPVAGCLMILGIVVAGSWSGARQREIQSHERLAAIAKGLPIPPTVEELAILHGKPASSLVRRRANIRLTGIVLLASAAGLIAFFIALSVILQVRPVLAGAAAGLIPLGVGLGFLYDSKIEGQELEDSRPDTPSTLL